MRTKRELTILAHCVAILYAKEKKMREDLCGLCMITSFSLYSAMKKNDKEYGTTYNPKLVLGASTDALHCWVESEGQIYDPTFIQFDFEDKPLHIGPPTVWHDVFTERYLAKWTTFKNVDKEQKPTPHKINNFLKRMYL